MHPNPAFRQTPEARNLAFARERAFGILCVNDAAGPLIAHVPFLLSEDGTTADFHLVRSNPVARVVATSQHAVIAVSGPDGYVSPDWYGVPDHVPTWNYIAVHLRGTVELLPANAMQAMLDRQTAHFEDQLVPKTPWTTGKMPSDLRERMMRQIVPARLTVTQVDGTWKLNQNKPDDARLRAARHMAGAPIGSDVALLAALMLAPPKR
jgi:transcriptional regulator